MNSKEFYDLTKSVRQAQKKYFRTRDFEDLKQSKHLEKLLDDEIKRVEEIVKTLSEPKLNFK